MRNEEIEQKVDILKSTLSDTQKEYVDALDWLYYGARGTGRSHLLCVVTLIRVLHGQDGVLIDHTPYFPLSKIYLKHILFELADRIGVPIRVREVRNGFIVSSRPDYVVERKWI